jgi:hypothetical protein
MVAGLRNVGDDLAGAVAEGLGMPELPAAISPPRSPSVTCRPPPR